MDLIVFAAIYLVPLLVAGAWYGNRSRTRHRTAVAALRESRAAGLSEPASLHPRIDPARCFGCASCVTACPEGEILGVIHGKAVLVSPASCIGHGACREACPADAITLVLGSEKRGVEIPVTDARYETNVRGLFVAGELGGMGLIVNAIEQGRRAVESVRRALPAGTAGLDLVIVGAGPAGFAASLAAKAQGLRYLTLEQESLGGTVAHYPRGKIVLTRPAELPLVGRVELRETSKEALLELWQRVAREARLEIRCGERVNGVQRVDDGFDVQTSRGSHRARAVLLAVGRRGTPRKLGVPGENRTKVVYRLVDPEQYRGGDVLVVGGGDSALEACVALAEQPGTHITLSYRGRGFSRAKPSNRSRLDAAVAAGAVQVLLESEVERIEPDRVELRVPGGRRSLRNDAIIVCAGGVLPSAFLRACGIEVETLYGEAIR